MATNRVAPENQARLIRKRPSGVRVRARSFFAARRAGAAGGGRWLDVGLGALGFLLGRSSVAGLLNPFGVAYAAAVIVARPGAALAAMAGVFLGSLAGQTWLTVLPTALVLVFLRPSLGAAGADRDGPRRGMVGGLVVFALSLLLREATVAAFTREAFAFATAAFDSLLSAVLTAVFIPAVDLLSGRQRRPPIGDQIFFVGVLLAAAGAGLSGLKVAGFAVDAAVSAYLVMVLASGGGPGLGAAVGVLVGVVAGLRTGLNPGAIGLDAMAGLLASMFSGLGKAGVIAGYLLARLVLGGTSGQPADLAAALVPAAAGAALFLITPWRVPSRFVAGGLGEDSSFEPAGPANFQVGAGRATAVPDEEDQPAGGAGQPAPTGATLRQLAGLFDDLAAAMQEVSAAKAAADDQVAQLFQVVSGRVCERCNVYSTCWKDNFKETCRRLLDLWTKAEVGPLAPDDFPRTGRRCLKPAEVTLVVDFLHQTGSLRRTLQQRLDYSREAMVDQCRAVAGIITEAVNRDGLNGAVERRLGMAVRRALARTSVWYDELDVKLHGELPKVALRTRRCPNGLLCREVLAPAISEAAETALAPLWTDCDRHSGAQFCLQAFRPHLPLACLVAVADRAKDGQAVSGDAHLARELDDGHMVLALSDGMGAGPRAARESQTALGLLERLLEAGFPAAAAVRTINSVLLLRTAEDTFATIDLAVLDLNTGDCDFTKIGACPTYLVRGERLLAIRASSVPAGILGDIEVEPERWRLRPGDTLVMLTDGAFGPSDGAGRTATHEAEAMRCLRAHARDGPRGLAEALIGLAGEGRRHADDLVVLVARVQAR
ncbi:MAG: SpoIIE family protein phosphatase [Bacillota bacterium]